MSHYVYKENANVIKYLTNVGSAVIGAARILLWCGGMRKLIGGAESALIELEQTCGIAHTMARASMSWLVSDDTDVQEQAESILMVCTGRRKVWKEGQSTQGTVA